MPTAEAGQETGLSPAMRELAVHLQQGGTAYDSPEELAARFGLDVPFVSEVLASLRAPVPSQPFTERFVEALIRLLRRSTRTIHKAWVQATENPSLFILASTLVFLIPAWLTRSVSRVQATTTVSGESITLNSGFLAWGTLALVTVHMLCYARHGKARFPIFGTFLAFFCVAGASLVVTGAQIFAGHYSPDRILPVIVASLAVSIPYSVLGMAASVLGGYSKAKQDIRSEMMMSRQELLQRLFEVENRLSRAKQAPDLMTPVQAAVHRVRNSPGYLGYMSAAGLGIGLLSSLSAVLVEATPALQGVSYFGTLVKLGASFIIVAGYLLIGYTAGSIKRSITGLYAAYIASTVPVLIPVKPLGIEKFAASYSFPEIVVVAVAFAATGLFTGIGAEVEQRATRSEKLSQNDVAVLLAELIRIQRRLQAPTQATCVLVVDAARSTRMKEGADPLRVEWSFRSYQGMVAQLAANAGGTVVSTAGDGAVVSFPSCQEALLAARGIQTEIPKFNQTENRLDTPFRLRIGLHTGRTQTEISEAPFSTVIDIAAHIESVAPIGGIAVSGSVARELPDEELAAMASEVDGQPVFIVLNPTLNL